MTSEPALTLPDVRIGGEPDRARAPQLLRLRHAQRHGLHLELHAGGDRCWTEIALDRRFEGWEGIAHGGIVCTLLDEVMAWALVEHDHWGVTARMSVDFKRPVPIGRPDPRRGPRGRGRGAGWSTPAGSSIDPATGELLARSEATYVAAPEARKDELKARYAFRVVPDEAAERRSVAVAAPELVDAG